MPTYWLAGQATELALCFSTDAVYTTRCRFQVLFIPPILHNVLLLSGPYMLSQCGRGTDTFNNAVPFPIPLFGKPTTLSSESTSSGRRGPNLNLGFNAFWTTSALRLPYAEGFCNTKHSITSASLRHVGTSRTRIRGLRVGRSDTAKPAIFIATYAFSQS